MGFIMRNNTREITATTLGNIEISNFWYNFASYIISIGNYQVIRFSLRMALEAAIATFR
jgi:hypothetical protein